MITNINYKKLILTKTALIITTIFALALILFTLISIYNSATVVEAITTINCSNGFTRDVDENGNTIPGSRHKTPEDDPKKKKKKKEEESVTCSTSSCISAPNVCGYVNFGRERSCSDGSGSSCNAQKPADPSGTCSVATACGVPATGFNGCGSGCNITNYPVCELIPDPECLDPSGCPLIIDWVTITGGVTDIKADIYANPPIVKRGTTSKIIWITQETTSCEVTGTNGDNWGNIDLIDTPTETRLGVYLEGEGMMREFREEFINTITGGRGGGNDTSNNNNNITIRERPNINADNNIFGERVSSKLQAETTYTVSCTGYNGTAVEDSVTVKILPIWQEI